MEFKLYYVEDLTSHKTKGIFSERKEAEKFKSSLEKQERYKNYILCVDECIYGTNEGE